MYIRLNFGLGLDVSASCIANTMVAYQSKFIRTSIFGFGRHRRDWNFSNRLARCSFFADFQVFLPSRCLQLRHGLRYYGCYAVKLDDSAWSFCSGREKDQRALGGLGMLHFATTRHTLWNTIGGCALGDLGSANQLIAPAGLRGQTVSN